jgi:MoxR-like ATPase
VRFVPAKARSPLSTSNPGTSASPRSSGDAPSAAVAAAAELTAALRAELAEVVVGQEHLIEGLLIGLLADGHVLLEGVPGLAKSLVVQALAEAIGASHHRVQFTPDLLPADLVGTQVYDPQRGVWSIHEGPVFANLVLADEINRDAGEGPGRVARSDAGAAGDGGGVRHELPSRSSCSRRRTRSSRRGPTRSPRRSSTGSCSSSSSATRRATRSARSSTAWRACTRGGTCSAVTDTAASARRARGTRRGARRPARARLRDRPRVLLARAAASTASADLVPFIRYGASPRASIALVQASRARALLQGRGYVVPEDVQAVGIEVLRHRVLPTFEAEARQMSVDAVVERILATVPVP